MDRLEAMELLVAVVESGGFTAASRKLGVPLPTISRNILDLEARLGAPLLTRSTRRLEPTEAGRDYVAACKRILDEVGEAERKAAGEYSAPKGGLSLTAPVVFGRLHVAPVIADFLRAYPEIDVRLSLSDRNASLTEDHLDVAVRIGALRDSAMVAVQAGTVRRIVCGGPGFFDKHGVPETPADLAGLPCVAFDGFGALSGWNFVGADGAEVSAPGRARLSVNSAEAAIDAAIADVGVTRVLSYQAAQAVASGRLRIVLEDFEPAPAPVNLIYARRGALPLKTRVFIDFALPRLKAALTAAAIGRRGR